MQGSPRPARPLLGRHTLSLTECGIANVEPSHHVLLCVDLKWMCHRNPGLQQILPIFIWRKELGLCFQGFKPGFRFLCWIFGWEVLALAWRGHGECAGSWTHWSNERYSLVLWG